MSKIRAIKLSPKRGFELITISELYSNIKYPVPVGKDITNSWIDFTIPEIKDKEYRIKFKKISKYGIGYDDKFANNGYYKGSVNCDAMKLILLLNIVESKEFKSKKKLIDYNRNNNLYCNQDALIIKNAYIFVKKLSSNKYIDVTEEDLQYIKQFLNSKPNKKKGNCIIL